MVLHLLVGITGQMLTIVLMKTVTVVHLHLRPVVFRIAMIKLGRGQTIDHLTEVLGKTGTLGGSQNIRTTGLTDLTRVRTSGTTGDTLGPLGDGPRR